jgi:hypothetical protein
MFMEATSVSWLAIVHRSVPGHTSSNGSEPTLIDFAGGLLRDRQPFSSHPVAKPQVNPA